MSEPKTIAATVEAVCPGVWRWFVPDDRIGDFESDAHAVEHEGRAVLIDPLPLTEEAFGQLGEVEAVCLTAACHQRSSWRLRRELGVPVHVPEGAATLEEEPDASYREGELLPGGLRAIRTPGPEANHYAFLLDRAGGVLFVADLFAHVGDELHFVPPEYHDDPAATRESARKLLDVPFAILCLDHGAPIADDPKAAIRKLLEQG